MEEILFDIMNMSASQLAGGAGVVALIAVRVTMNHIKRKNLVEKVITKIDEKDIIHKTIKRDAKDIIDVDVYKGRF